MKITGLHAFAALLIVLMTGCATENKEYTFSKGQVYGTYYSITYLHPRKKDLHRQIEEKFSEFDNSLSTFNPNQLSHESTAMTHLYAPMPILKQCTTWRSRYPMHHPGHLISR